MLTFHRIVCRRVASAAQQLFNKCYAVMRVISSFYAWYVVLRSRCRHQCIPRYVVAVVLAPFVRDGSVPPALAVVADDRRFGQAVDDDNDGLSSHSQSISYIDHVMTSSSCLLSLLVSVIFIAILILPKRPSQSWRRTTSKKSRSYPPPLLRRCRPHPLLRHHCRRCPPTPPAQ